MKIKKQKLEKCGFCGSYFIGNHILTVNERKQLKQDKLNNALLGYCPNAQEEDYQQNPEKYRTQITKDMAIDAGMPELEGQFI
jgi:hypothetical protein